MQEEEEGDSFDRITFAVLSLVVVQKFSSFGSGGEPKWPYEIYLIAMLGGHIFSLFSLLLYQKLRGSRVPSRWRETANHSRVLFHRPTERVIGAISCKPFLSLAPSVQYSTVPSSTLSFSFRANCTIKELFALH